MIVSCVNAKGSAAACFNTASAKPARILLDCENCLLVSRHRLALNAMIRGWAFKQINLGLDTHAREELMDVSVEATALTALCTLILYDNPSDYCGSIGDSRISSPNFFSMTV
jgi:hypothetical protein